jgi:hypothetical protein
MEVIGFLIALLLVIVTIAVGIPLIILIGTIEILFVIRDLMFFL